MLYKDLREFIADLEKDGLLKRITTEVDSHLEMSEIMERVIKSGGPALLFENPKGSDMPVLANLYGTRERVGRALGVSEDEFYTIGEYIAELQNIKPKEGMMEKLKQIPFFARAATLGPKTASSGVCQEVVLKGSDVDLDKFPITFCWPEDAAPLVTWPLVVTQSPEGGPQNVGVYRMQKIGKDKLIMRWLTHRGGAKHHREWLKTGKPMPVSIAIGCEPATTIAAVTPLPEYLSEFNFAGVLRKKPIELVKCLTNDLKVPSTSEIILEGEIVPGEESMEGPYGDHTGYYNPAEPFPVFKINAITHRKNPIYLTTITGRPPKEDAIIGTVLNNIYLPSLKVQFPEVVDFSLPMEAVSYRIAVISIKKEYPGHAKRIMLGFWGILKQFLYVKYVIVVDEDIDVHNWDDVVWALATRVDPARDSFTIEDTPIDYLDFSSPKDSLGSKMGIDATNKIGSEVTREWGTKIEMTEEIKDLVTKKWKDYGIDS